MYNQNVFHSHKFLQWKSKIEENGLIIENIEEKFTRHSDNGEILFSTLMLNAEMPEGGKMPPICFLKGEVVSVLVCLIEKITKEKYLLLVTQRRIGNGAITFEHPAGMVDEGYTPMQVAIKEVQEETNLKIEENQIIAIREGEDLFCSPGTSDEFFHFFYCELEMEKKEIDSFNNKRVDPIDSFEKITTVVVPFLDGHKKINNTNLLLLNYMYLSAVKDFILLNKI